MGKIGRIDYINTAIYILALTAARDMDATKEEDKQALEMIRDFMEEVITKNNGNTVFTKFSTIGMSETEAIELAKSMEEEK